MTDTVDTSKEAVERLADWLESGHPEADPSEGAAHLRALIFEVGQLRRELEEARSVRGAASVLLAEEAGMSDELNSAGWEFIKAWGDIVQEPLSGMAFNHCKPLLRRVFDYYLRALKASP